MASLDSDDDSHLVSNGRRPFCCWPRSPLSRKKDSRNKDYDTLKTIHEAAKEGDLKAINGLLAKGADVNERNGEEDRSCAYATPLILAARGGHESMVRRLLQEPQLDINASTTNLDNGARSKQTALHWAAREGKVPPALDIIEDPRLEVDARTQLGFTALWVAAQSGQTQIMRSLLKKKADALVDCYLTNGFRMTPVVTALIDTQPESLRILIAEGGADKDEVLQLVTVKHTPLGASAACNWLGHVRVLLDLKADVNKEFEGTNPFDLAYKEHATEIVLNLLVHGCDTSKILSPVRHSQIVGDAAALQQLIQQKKVLPKDVVPDLHVATIEDNAKKLQAVLTKMSDAKGARYTVDGGNMPALFYAIELNHFSTCRVLMKDVHGFSDDMVKGVLEAVGAKRDYAIGERMFLAIMALLHTTASEERQYAKGAAALLQPWMGSVPALQFFKGRQPQFDELRAICHRRSEAIYERIDQACMSVLGQMATIGRKYIDLNVRQDDPQLLPKFEYFWDEKKGHTAAGDHELFYAMDVALIASACDDFFWGEMIELFGQIAKKVHRAPPKTFTRMNNKLINPKEHGDPSIPKPRPAKNVDVLRCGVEVSTAEDMKRVFDALESKYKILRVKNSHDPQDSGFGGYRSILVNFALPIGKTFGDVFGIGRFEPDGGIEDGWMREDETAEQWFKQVTMKPQKIDWMWSLSGLWRVARSQPDREIVISSEIQIIYEPYMIGRSLSHLLFKISRCETGPDEMVRDFATGFVEVPSHAEVTEAVKKEAPVKG